MALLSSQALPDQGTAESLRWRCAVDEIRSEVLVVVRKPTPLFAWDSPQKGSSARTAVSGCGCRFAPRQRLMPDERNSEEILRDLDACVRELTALSSKIGSLEVQGVLDRARGLCAEASALMCRARPIMGDIEGGGFLSKPLRKISGNQRRDRLLAVMAIGIGVVFGVVQLLGARYRIVWPPPLCRDLSVTGVLVPVSDLFSEDPALYVGGTCFRHFAPLDLKYGGIHVPHEIIGENLLRVALLPPPPVDGEATITLRSRTRSPDAIVSEPIRWRLDSGRVLPSRGGYAEIATSRVAVVVDGLDSSYAVPMRPTNNSGPLVRARTWLIMRVLPNEVLTGPVGTGEYGAAGVSINGFFTAFESIIGEAVWGEEEFVMGLPVPMGVLDAEGLPEVMVRFGRVGYEVGETFPTYEVKNVTILQQR